MKYHTPTTTVNIQKDFVHTFGESRSRVGFRLSMAVLALLEDALAFGALGNLPAARAADLTMSTPTSIATAPSVPSRDNGSSRSSSSSSWSSCVG